MKRSALNRAYLKAKACFEKHGWALPPNPKWDITDCGLRDFKNCGLVLINLAEEPEYCEKLMYNHKLQVCPAHCHKKKKEDIICRHGELAIVLWPRHPQDCREGESFSVKINGESRQVTSGEKVVLPSGERITLCPGIYHEFFPQSDECILSEVSTANDDANDNFFVNEDIGRFPGIDEDEPPLVILVSES